MDIKEIKALIKLLEGTDVRELELVRDKDRIRITRQTEELAGKAPRVMAKMESPREKPESGGEKNYKTITSPMVGTFYRSQAPDAPPFVEEGSVVHKGQAICIVEAMKLMNEIESDCDGRIVSILVGTAQPVEFGEPLFLVEPL